jgi:hypothetical protein
MVYLRSTYVTHRGEGNFYVHFLNNTRVRKWTESVGKLKFHICDHQNARNSYI